MHVNGDRNPLSRRGLYFPESDDIWLISQNAYEAICNGEARVPSLAGHVTYSLHIALFESPQGHLYLENAEGSQIRFDDGGLGHGRNGAAPAVKVLPDHVDELVAGEVAMVDEQVETSGDKAMHRRHLEATEIRVTSTSRPDLYHRLVQVLVDKGTHDKVLCKTPAELGVVYDRA